MKHMFGCAKINSGKLQKADGILIAAVLAGALFVGLVSHALRLQDPPMTAVIEQDGRELMRLSLKTGQQVRIESRDGGYNVVEIGTDGVRITQADCPDLTCVHQGMIFHTGETIVCLPHRLTVRLEGGTDNGPDAVTG